MTDFVAHPRIAAASLRVSLNTVSIEINALAVSEATAKLKAIF